MKVTELTHDMMGKAFIALIERKECTGRIQYYDGSFFLCQNIKDGCNCPDKLGYKYSWSVGSGTDYRLRENNVSELRVLDKLDNIWVDPVTGFSPLIKKKKYLTVDQNV